MIRILKEKIAPLSAKRHRKFEARVEVLPVEELRTLDRWLFRLKAKEFNRFAAALNRLPTDNPRLRDLLESKPPWDSRSQG